MTKLAIITDTHYGVRGDHHAFIDNTKMFLDNIFFPYIKEHKIDTIIHLGDVVDRRKFINFYTLSRLRQDFLEPIRDLDISLHITVGNHDTTYKNTNSLNALTE